MDLDTIRKRIEQLEKLQEEVKISKDMLKGELENDLTYLEAAEEVKAAVQKRKQIKDAILGTGPNQEVMATVKENMEEISTLKEILSAELVQVYKENESDEVAGRKFKINVRLMPKQYSHDNRDSFGKYSKED